MSAAAASAAATAAAPAVVAAASAAAASAAAAAAATVTAPAAAASAAVVASESSLLQSIVDFFSVHHISSVSNDKISSFQFVQGVTPLSSIWGVVICVLLYFATIRLLQRWVAARGKPFDLNWFVILHNSLLSILSAVLFFALVSEIATVVRTAGVWSLFCDPSGRHVGGALYFIYFLNYIAKYVELIDTCLLALRGKPIPFLHAYHHAATLVLCWSQLWAQSCIQWLPIVINLLVHVVMYAYYTLHAMGFSIWWKKYLTLLQITQFIVALIGCVGAFSTRLLSLNFPDTLPLADFKCHGTHGGAWVGIGIIASYLYLFVVLFREKYDDKAKDPAAKAAAAEARARKHAQMRKIRPVLIEDELSAAAAAQSRELAEKAAEKVNQRANGNGRHED